MGGELLKVKGGRGHKPPSHIFWPFQSNWNSNWERTVCCPGVDAHGIGLVLVEKSGAVSISPLCTPTGAFLIPYVVFFICCGIPVFFLETALGQFTSEGGITCWRRVCPLFEGMF